MADPKINVTTKADKDRLDNMRVIMQDIEGISRNIRHSFISMAQNVGQFATQQLMEPLEGMKSVVQQLSDVDFSSLTRYSSILSQIVSMTKSLSHEYLGLEQQLIGIYKGVAEVAKGSSEIYSLMAKTHQIGKDNLMIWNEGGGYAVGIQLATEIASHATGVIGQMSSDLLLTMHKQNKAMGISNEESAKMAGYMTRAGITLEDAVGFQKQIYGLIKNSYGTNVLTSKVMSKITQSNFSIFLYTSKNADQLAKIAMQAHEGNVEIDEIYQTSMKLAKAESAIETSRKFQLAFGIKLNARQMQYNAQTGKHLENTQSIISSLKNQGVQFDKLVLAQQQIIADTIAGGDLSKAHIMLMGKQVDIANKQLSPQDRMVASLEKQSELLGAMQDSLANYGMKQTLIRTGLGKDGKEHLGFIFGKNKDISTVESFTLGLEEERVRVLGKVFLPMLQRFSQFMSGRIPLLGEGSLVDNFANMFIVLGEKVSEVGETVFKGFIEKKVLERLTKALQTLNTFVLANKITEFGESFIRMITAITKEGAMNRIMDSIGNFIGVLKNVFWVIGKLIGVVSHVGVIGSMLIFTAGSAFSNIFKLFSYLGKFEAVQNALSAVGGGFSKFLPVIRVFAGGIYGIIAGFRLISDLIKIMNSDSQHKGLDAGKAVINAASLGIIDLQYDFEKKRDQHVNNISLSPDTLQNQEESENRLADKIVDRMFVTEAEAKRSRKGIPIIQGFNA